MAELLVGPLLSAVKDKASNKLLEKYEVMEGMEQQHKILRRTLPAILDIITDAEEQAVHREGAKAWLEELKMVAYAANEVFDEFKYEALRRQARVDGHYTKLGFHVIKLFPTHNRVAFRYRMGHKLRQIVQEIEVLMAAMNTFGFKYQRQAPTFKQWRETDSIILVDTKDIISRSRDAEKQKIVQILMNATANLTVVPIVGMGGLGKTTLAQLIYNDHQVRRHFQHLKWVCVSDVFDVYDLARKICPSKGDGDTALITLQKELTGKRYLLVLDDVWNQDVDKWNKLKTCLQNGATGSVILVTTRINGTAALMGCTTLQHDVTVLDNKFIHEIIETRAFNMQPAPDQLKNMIRKFVERCGGSPLAAKALGSVLGTKTSEEQWEAVLKKSIICTKESGILPILKLSYDVLPSYMKQCFAFCAVFPKDYEIDVEKLIQLWIANGFIQAQKEISPESIGTHIFNELTSRSFFQDIKQVQFYYDEQYNKIYYSRTTCTIHDLMHDVALSIMGKECVVETEERPSQTEWLPDTARHVFLSSKEPNNVLNDAMKKGSPAIQTLLCNNDVAVHSRDQPLQHLSKYSSMQALRLFQSNKSFQLKPKHLRHLRYLDLSRSGIEELPRDISILYNLQTLDISRCGCLRRLPREIKYLTSLRHLYTHGCDDLKSMPPDLGKLTSLQTLTCFVAGSGSYCSNIGEIQNLDLGGQLELRQLENVTITDAKKANLVKKKRLEKLKLAWSRGREEEDIKCDSEVLEGLTPHDELQVLRINNYEGVTFPNFIGMLPKMVRLSLVHCDRCENLPLRSLPVLQELSLDGLSKLRCLCSPDASFDLPNLKELKLEWLPDLERWWEIDEQHNISITFPQLEKLDIEYCRKLTALPGQQTFPNLQSVSVKYSPKFIIIPEAPKLSVLEIRGGNHQMSLCVARFMNSLIVEKLHVDIVSETHSNNVEGEEKWNEKSPLVELELGNFHMLFGSGAVVTLWTCFVHLQELEISECDALVHWPEKEFESLVSLKTLEVSTCRNLSGYAPEASMSQLLPCLESLDIRNCPELVEVYNMSGSIKNLTISRCDKIESTIFRKQQGKSAESYSEMTGAVPEAEHVTSVPATEIFLHPFLPSLKVMWIERCDSLSGVLNVPPSLKKMWIESCNNLQSISWQLDEIQTEEDPSAAAREHFSSPCLEDVFINDCGNLTEIPSMPQTINTIAIHRCDMLKSLESLSGGVHPLLRTLTMESCKTLAILLPDDDRSYSSLQRLEIKGCPALKTLPMCLQQRLSSLEEKDVDACYEGTQRHIINGRGLAHHIIKRHTSFYYN